MNATRIPITILGAGPAGLGAAYRLARRGGFDVTVIERGAAVGGNAGSFELAGMQVDYGSHRLHPSCAPEILADIRNMLGESLLDRPRHGRIRLRGRWVHFPLKAADLALHLPPSFLTGVALDSVGKMVSRRGQADTFAAVLRQGLGRTICDDFYFPYARKIWGVDPETLDAEQARRRVSAGSLLKMVRKVLNAVPGFKKKGAGRFFYPKRGFGAISEAYRKSAESAGARLRMQTTVAGIETSGGRVCAVRTSGPSGEEQIEARQVLSTIPISRLASLMQPAAPEAVQASARALQFRAMILIYLVLGVEQFTEFDAHYFPDADVLITRLSEPKNYGLEINPGRTVLCAELPCSTEDAVWRASDRQLGEIVTRALEQAGLPVRCPVLEVASRKLPQAYPIYTRGYQKNFEQIDRWLDGIEGLVTFGRQGLFAHDNTHHALAMAYALDGCLRNDGSFDREAWAACREEFQHHVVED
jgi:protoporphyrinogen oxidase